MDCERHLKTHPSGEKALPQPHVLPPSSLQLFYAISHACLRFHSPIFLCDADDENSCYHPPFSLGGIAVSAPAALGRLLCGRFLLLLAEDRCGGLHDDDGGASRHGDGDE